MILRPAGAGDVDFLHAMLYEAAHWSPDRPRMDRAEARTHPRMAHYVDGFPRPGDAGVVAEEDGRPIGAAWYRRFSADAPADGFVAEDIPEVAIAVVAEARGRGVGTALLTALLDRAAAEGLGAVSLSVEDANPARRLYEHVGFERVGGTPGSSTMVHRLGGRPGG
ncbi:MAG TPA: GNAT family N-acetyltransferase [Acidimicrobiales bacterium]